MARGTLVISCGGAGKGVLNFVKQALRDRYGSVQAAGTVLLAIDGPPPEADGVYKLADGSSLSSNAADGEFYGLTQNPQVIFDAIDLKSPCSEDAFPFVAQRIPQADAHEIRNKVPGMAPASGMGGCRPVGHANLCMEAPQLQGAISSALARVRPLVPQGDSTPDGQHVNQTNIFLVGCQFGGTGAGQLVDVAQVIRSQMQANERLILVLILPDAFDSVLRPKSPTRGYADAKAYCGLREFVRMRRSLGVMDTIEYSPGVVTPYSHLFDLCFLVDGKSGALDLSTRKPMVGVLPAVGDAVTSMILDGVYTSTQLIDWTSRSTVVKHYSTVGSHTWVFPAERLIKDQALQFAETVYQHILQEGDAARLAAQRTDSLMNSTLFTQLALDLSHYRELPTAPDQWRALRPRLTVPITAPEWPQSPGHECLSLPVEVKTSGAFWGPSNADVKEDTDEQLLRYLGQPTDAYETTVHGWLNNNSSIVQRVFVDELLRLIRDLFYERQQDGSFTPRPLSQHPNTIVEAAHFLESTSQMLSGIQAAFTRDLQEKGMVPDPERPGQAIAISTLARRRVDKIGAQMGSGRDRGLQQEYIAASQVYLEARLWELLMDGAKRLAGDLIELVKVSWGWVGDAASGWQTYLRDVCLKAVQAERTKLRSVAAEEDRIACRTTYPRAGSIAERELFRQIVSQLDLVPSALQLLSWELTDVQPTGDPKRDLEGCQLLLRSGIIPPSETNHQMVVTRDLIQGDTRKVQLSTHSPEHIRAYGAQHIRPHISQLSIWDGLYVSYRHGWLRKRGAQDDAQLRHEFIQKSVQWLRDQSGVLLRNAQGADQPVFCFSNFISDDTEVGQFAAAFEQELQASMGGVHRLPELKRELRVLNFQHGLDFTAWSYLDSARQNYEAHNTAKELPPVHIYCNERYAYEIEGTIATKIKFAQRAPLSPKVTCLMTDPAALETFLLGYAADLFDRLDDPQYPNTFPYLGIEQPRRISLGRRTHWDEVLRRYLAKAGQSAQDARTVRETIDQRLKNKMITLKTADEQKQFFTDLLARAGAPDLFATDSATSDANTPWDEWRDVLAAVVHGRAQMYGIAL
ncbi:MAG: tubulin-like doman-containing protein [Armatimonadota bacterium]